MIKIQALSPETSSLTLILASEASLGERAGEAQIDKRQGIPTALVDSGWLSWTLSTSPGYMSQKVVVASGYFDPLHYGHIEYLERSRDQNSVS